MSLTQTSTVDETTIAKDGTIFYRINNLVMDGTTQIAQGYVRNTLYPGQDLTDIPTSVVAIANVVWTDEVISAYKASLPTTITGA